MKISDYIKCILSGEIKEAIGYVREIANTDECFCLYKKYPFLKILLFIAHCEEYKKAKRMAEIYKQGKMPIDIILDKFKEMA